MLGGRATATVRRTVAVDAHEVASGRDAVVPATTFSSAARSRRRAGPTTTATRFRRRKVSAATRWSPPGRPLDPPAALLEALRRGEHLARAVPAGEIRALSSENASVMRWRRWTRSELVLGHRLLGERAEHAQTSSRTFGSFRGAHAPSITVMPASAKVSIPACSE